MEIKPLLAAFIVILVGVALIGVISTEQADITQMSKISDESITLTKQALDVNTTITYTLEEVPDSVTVRDTECNLSLVQVTNSSGGTVFTDVTDYVINPETSVITFKNTSATVTRTDDNKTLVSYSYCGDGYLSVGWGRTILNMVPGFFAIAILGIALGFFYTVFKKAGIA